MARAEFVYQDPLPLAKDTTSYRLLTRDHVSVTQFDGKEILKIDPQALIMLANEAMRDVSFLLRTAQGNIGFLTDLGHTTKMVIERVRTANVLLLEANHDVKLLQNDTRRPWSLKQRILSRHGHLSNDGAADAAEQIVSAELRHLYLGHLSRDCNRPELAHRAVSDRLQKIGAHHVHVDSTSQDVPCPTLSLAQLEQPVVQPQLD